MPSKGDQLGTLPPVGARLWCVQRDLASRAAQATQHPGMCPTLRWSTSCCRMRACHPWARKRTGSPIGVTATTSTSRYRSTMACSASTCRTSQAQQGCSPHAVQVSMPVERLPGGRRVSYTASVAHPKALGCTW
jgi:hypothetical protein